jgi:hypothetical protein
MVVNRYLSALLSTAIVLLGAFVAIPRDAWSFGNPQVGSFVALAVATIISYVVKLLPSGWQAGAKVGVQIVGGVFAAVWPLFLGAEVDWFVVVLAALNALATQLGVDARLDDPTLNKAHLNEVRKRDVARAA